MNGKLSTLMQVALLLLAVGYIYRGTYRAQLTNRLKNKDYFIVGTAAGYAPFVSVNSRGEYEGFDIDIARAVAQRMNKKLLIKDLGSMAPLFIALDQGSIDAIIWGLSITQERLQKVAMIQYQGEATTAYSLIFWQEIPNGIKMLDDMKDMTICVEPASAQDGVLSKYPSIKKLPTEKVDDALLNIQYKKAAAAFVEPAIARKFKKRYQEIQILDVPLAQEDYVQGIGIAVKKDNQAIIKRIQIAVDQLKQEGIIKRAEEQWNIL